LLKVSNSSVGFDKNVQFKTNLIYLFLGLLVKVFTHCFVYALNSNELPPLPLKSQELTVTHMMVKGLQIEGKMLLIEHGLCHFVLSS
jgi:hypothetical protein